MSEHDDEQRPPGRWRLGASRDAADEGVDADAPWVPPAAPTPLGQRWSSPGSGQPYPGQGQATRPFSYPFPGGVEGAPLPPPAAPTYPGAPATPAAAPFTPPYPGRPNYSAPPPKVGSPPTYPGATQPGAAGPTYPGGPAYPGASYPGATQPGAGGPAYPGASYPGGGAPAYPGGPGYPGGGAPAYPGVPANHGGSYSAGPAQPPYGGGPRYGDPYAYPGGGGGYGEPAPGWSGGWRPPPPPPGYGTWGPGSPDWLPSPSAPTGRRGVIGAIVLVAVLVAASVGLAIGSQLQTRHATVLQLPSTSGGVASSGGGLPAPQAKAIAAVVDRCVVDIDSQLGYQQAAAAGTGMVLTSSGEILTNNHVIAGATRITATPIGGKPYAVKVLGTDPTDDVALLQLQGASGLTPCTTGDPSKLTSTQPIVAVGNAGGVGGTPSVVTGTVAALGQSVTASDVGGANAEQLTDMIEINAPLEPGDSGGPLITAAGQVVGMDTAASTSGRFGTGGSIGFSIPITRAVSIAQQIAAGHASVTIQIGLPGFLGVSVDPTNPGSVTGAAVSGVLPGTPADKSGLADGDVVTSIDGHAVDSADALTAIMQQHHGGDKVIVGWVDPSGASHTATVTLIAGPAA